jgi:hypothetical protein
LLIAQLGNCALAVVIVVIDTSAAPTRIFIVVIVVLRIADPCGELAQATAAALLSAFPADFFFCMGPCKHCIRERSSRLRETAQMIATPGINAERADEREFSRDDQQPFLSPVHRGVGSISLRYAKFRSGVARKVRLKWRMS